MLPHKTSARVDPKWAHHPFVPLHPCSLAPLWNVSMHFWNEDVACCLRLSLSHPLEAMVRVHDGCPCCTCQQGNRCSFQRCAWKFKHELPSLYIVAYHFIKCITTRTDNVPAPEASPPIFFFTLLCLRSDCFQAIIWTLSKLAQKLRAFIQSI